MGMISSRLAAFEGKLMLSQAEDLKIAMDISLFVQIVAYYLGLASSVSEYLKSPSIPSEPPPLVSNKDKRELSGPKYIEELRKVAVMYNPLFITSVMHQILASNFMLTTLSQKKLTLAAVLPSTATCFFFAAVSWMEPIKVLAISSELQSGNMIVYTNLRNLIESETTAIRLIKSALLAAGSLAMYMTIKAALWKSMPFAHRMYGVVSVISVAELALDIDPRWKWEMWKKQK